MAGVPEIRPFDSARDLDQALALNNAAVPAVNHLDAAGFLHILKEASVALVAEDAGQIIGLLLGHRPGAAYDSENYRWFERHLSDFLYIDRIIVSETARGAGLGKAFYRHLAAKMAGHVPALCCEVNERPPNPASLRFHLDLGFAEVGRQETGGGEKSVILLKKPL